MWAKIPDENQAPVEKGILIIGLYLYLQIHNAIPVHEKKRWYTSRVEYYMSHVL